MGEPEGERTTGAFSRGASRREKRVIDMNGTRVASDIFRINPQYRDPFGVGITDFNSSKVVFSVMYLIRRL